ncbi:MAG: RNA methyltransferase [Burkholderiales bacterium]|jgi:TrmH family RNA methyltransferase|nr:RNA methyltransferase [Burkholderiales bacterium]
MKRVHSRDNPLFRTLHRLATSSRERRERRAALLDGPHLVAAFADRGGVAEAVVASESGLAHPEARRLLDGVAARGRAILDDRLFADVAQVATPVGILAWVTVPEPEPLPRAPFDCVVLEEIQDAGNLGSILRTAAAAGVREIFLSKGSAFAWSPKVLRAGQGAHFALSIRENAALDEVAARFRGSVVATELGAPTSVFEVDLRGPVAWILGNEGAGISDSLAARATVRAHIPMPGHAESLNVAAAAAVCLFESVRQRAAAPRLNRRGAPA